MWARLDIFKHWFFQELHSSTPQWILSMIYGETAPKHVFCRSDISNFIVENSNLFIPDTWLFTPGENRQTVHENAHLHLPCSIALERTISLPAVGRMELDNVARLDIIRRTPFNLDDISWAQRPLSKQGKNLDIQQFIVENETLKEIEENLLSHGVKTGAFFLESLGKPILLARGTHSKTKAQSKIYAVNKILATVTLLLLSTYVVGGGIKQNSVLRDLSTENATLKSQAISIRKDIEQQQADLSFMSERSQYIYNRHKLSTVLRDFTVALPDHASITNLNYSQSNVTVAGSTQKSSADLVLKLSKIKTIQNPRLTGSISKNINGSEKFELAYDLKVKQ